MQRKGRTLRVKKKEMRMQKFVITVAMLGFVLFGSGCTTIVGKSKSPVTILSNPIGARVTIKDKSGVVVQKGVTPMTAVLPASAGYFKSAEYQLAFEKDGYDPTSSPTLKPRVNGWYFGNIIFCCGVGFLIDPATGKMWEFDNDRPFSDDLLPVGKESEMKRILEAYKVGVTTWQQCQSDITSGGWTAFLTGLTLYESSGAPYEGVTSYYDIQGVTHMKNITTDGLIEMRTPTKTKAPDWVGDDSYIGNSSRVLFASNGGIPVEPEQFRPSDKRHIFFDLIRKACAERSDVFEMTIGRTKHPICRLIFERKNCGKAILVAVDFTVKYPPVQSMHRKDWKMISDW
jgi:hypothetical protein